MWRWKWDVASMIQGSVQECRTVEAHPADRADYDALVSALCTIGADGYTEIWGEGGWCVRVWYPFAPYHVE